MIHVLSHWGPDRIGGWAEGQVGLGHLALWTTPEAVHESCPFGVPEAGVTVTADARIDNRAELMAKLNLRDGNDRSVGDVELIARAYMKWGEECLAHLVGDFAFALWDARARRLFCARDPFGIRPFYFFLDERRFVFGSEIKAIFAAADLPREWNPLYLGLAVLGGKLEGEHTQFRSIVALAPACALSVTAAGARKWRFWRLDPEFEIHFRRDEEYVEAFEEKLQAAVDARLRAPDRVASMLSGGLDATTVTHFAAHSRQFSRDRLTAYTWALRAGDPWHRKDEREYVDAYLAEHPVDHRYIIPNPAEMFTDTPGTRHLLDGPVIGPSSYAAGPTFSAARSQNIRVLLFGHGGDEVASYAPDNFLLGLLMARDWRGLASEAHVHAERLGVPRWKAWKNYIFRPLLNREFVARSIACQDRLAFFRDIVEKREATGLPLAENLIRDSGLAGHLKSRHNPNRAWSHLVRRQQIDAITGSNVWSHIATRFLNTSVLWSSECRFPYLDRRVVEYCVALPPDQHRRDGWPRRLLRRVADRRIPHKIARRFDKSATLPDFDRGLRQLEEQVNEALQRWDAEPRVTAYLDVGEMRRRFALFFADSPTVEPKVGLGALCRAVQLGLFLEKTSSDASGGNDLPGPRG